MSAQRNVPKRPVGQDELHHFCQWVWDTLTGLRFNNSPSVRVKQTRQGITFEAVVVKGGGLAAFPWQSPKELDPTVDVSAGIFVYVSPQNPLAATGLTDLVSDETVIATPGIWQAVQDVPAEVTVAGTVKYNVPQPLAQAATSGSPLEGDADADGLFWIPWSATGTSCF